MVPVYNFQAGNMLTFLDIDISYYLHNEKKTKLKTKSQTCFP